MFTIYSANVLGKADNTRYPTRCDISCEDDLRAAVGKDYVCAEYRGGQRSNNNFIRANCLPLDCDNDHSDDPGDWIYPSTIADTFSGVAFAAHYSRHHWKEKTGEGGKVFSPRPRFHVLFSINEMTDSESYKALKERVTSIYPYFDTNALDAARFFFGTSDPSVQFFDGPLTLDEFLADSGETVAAPPPAPVVSFSGGIPQGTRNATMSVTAAKLLKRYGDTPEARERFDETAMRCEPPLDSDELETIWRSALKFYATVSAQEGYIPPEEFGKATYKPDVFSDVGQAKMLAQVFKDRLAFSLATDYLAYDGRVWLENRLLAQSYAQTLTAYQMKEADSQLAQSTGDLEAGLGFKVDILTPALLKKAVTNGSTDDMTAYRSMLAAKEYLAFVIKRQDSKYIAAALKEAQPRLMVDTDKLDSDEFLLNTPFCTWDLRTCEPYPHCPEDLITRMTSIDPSDMGAPLWGEALDTFFCSDRELIDYVQRIVGLAAIGKVYLEALIIAYGEGRNGKSTFWNTIQRVLGTYSGSLSADALTVGVRRNVKPELAELRGKRLVIAGELEEGMRLSTSTVKQLCSTDRINVEKKYKDPFTFEPTHTLVLYTNYLPKVGTIDAGTWRRLIVIPFNAKIEGTEEVKNYGDYLYRHAGPAVMTWIMNGARQVIEEGFKLNPPAVVREAIRHYRESQDWMAGYLDERCELGKGYQVKSGELLADYRYYCAQTGEYQRSTSDFYTALEQVEGVERRKRIEGIMVYGLRLKSEFQVK